MTNDLEKNDSQLFRYFTAKKAKFGILTNGNTYKFYTDLESPNVMDKSPFLTLNIDSIRDNQFNELFKFTKENFNVDNIFNSASDLKYVNLTKEYISKQMNAPDEDFIKLVLSNIYSGVKTKQIIEEFKPVIIKGLNQTITDQVNSKLSKALKQTVTESDVDDVEEDTSNSKNDDIITTPEELESFTVAKVILKDTVDTSRIFYRDNKSYFNVLLDDNNRKWIFRIYFRSNKNYIILNDDLNSEIEFKNPINIYDFKDLIIKSCLRVSK